MENFKAQSFEDIFRETDQNSHAWSGMFEKQAKEAGDRFNDAFGRMSDKIGDAASKTEFKDVTGAGDNMAKAMSKFKDSLMNTQFIDKFGAGEKKEEIALILKDAFDRIKKTTKPDTTNIKGIKPVFGSSDSLASVGGGGGVGTGLMGVLDESKRQTRLQEQMVSLLQGSGGIEGATPSPTLKFGF